MNCVELNLRLLDLDSHLHLVVGLRHCLQLTDGVGGEATPLGSVVQHQPLGSLVIHKVGRRSNPVENKIFEITLVTI